LLKVVVKVYSSFEVCLTWKFSCYELDKECFEMTLLVVGYQGYSASKISI